MKAKDVEIGGTYMAKVSGFIVPVKVLKVVDKYDWKDRKVTRYYCRNQATGRAITIKSPQRFRSRIR